MNLPFVMTLIGLDKPGLVASIAAIVADHGGNWLESRMSQLGGHFAGILKFELPPENQPALMRKLQELEKNGLRIVIEKGAEKAKAPGAKQGKLQIVGQDRPGIVRQISEALTRRQVNVQKLSTECGSAPMSGEMLFQAEAEIEIPASTSIEEIHAELEKIAGDLMVDFKFEKIAGEGK